jgi:hypothetical protein
MARVEPSGRLQEHGSTANVAPRRSIRRGRLQCHVTALRAILVRKNNSQWPTALEDTGTGHEIPKLAGTAALVDGYGRHVFRGRHALLDSKRRYNPPALRRIDGHRLTEGTPEIELLQCSGGY